MDLSPATFALWKREARRAGERVAFARVEVVPTHAGPIRKRRAGMRLVVRGAAGHQAALDGVDGVTAVRLVALVLGRR
jgi:membrane protein YdbS with pleckstrin-like domain